MLGVAHSALPEATMFAVYEPGSIEQRTLAPDDQDAVCTIYPNRSQRLAASGLVASTPCNLAPGDPNGNCGDPDLTHGCSTTMANGTSRTGVGGLALLVAAGVIVARKRARNAPRP
jgi:MYXO-CTERM domain-containing protein